jgi:hypothetical protein
MTMLHSAVLSVAVAVALLAPYIARQLKGR